MDKCKSLIIIGLLYMCKFIPDKTAISLGIALGNLLQKAIGFRKKIIYKNIDRVYPHWSLEEKRTFIKKVYRHFGLLLVELCRMPFMDNKKFKKLFIYHGLEHLNAALSHKKGVMIMTGHLGNWEYGAAAMALAGYDVRLVAKEMRNVDNTMLYGLLRARKSVRWIGKKKAMYGIFRALKSNACVGFVMDQHTSRTEGVVIDFLGHRARAYAGLYTIARRKSVPVVPVYSWRDDNMRHHHIKVLPAVELCHEHGGSEERLRYNTQKFMDLFEKMMMAHPDQWIWMHRRWKIPGNHM